MWTRHDQREQPYKRGPPPSPRSEVPKEDPKLAQIAGDTNEDKRVSDDFSVEEAKGDKTKKIQAEPFVAVHHKPNSPEAEANWHVELTKQ